MVKDLKNRARQALEGNRNTPRRLVLIYLGITLGASFLSVLVSMASTFLLHNASGLAAMKTRALWDTATMVLSLLGMVLTPFLALGFFHSILQLSRGKEMAAGHLLMGLRRWIAILWMGMLHCLIYFFLLYTSVQVASLIYSFLPGSTARVEAVYAMMQDPAILAGNISTEQLLSMLQMLKPVYIMAGIFFGVLFLRTSYRLRMCRFLIIDDAPMGALRAMVQSFRMMKGHRLALFRVDLSFWWYYLLKLAIVAVFFVCGPMLSDLWYLLASLGYCGAMIALECYCLPFLTTTYAGFYNDLIVPETPQISQ